RKSGASSVSNEASTGRGKNRTNALHSVLCAFASDRDLQNSDAHWHHKPGRDAFHRVLIFIRKIRDGVESVPTRFMESPHLQKSDAHWTMNCRRNVAVSAASLGARLGARIIASGTLGTLAGGTPDAQQRCMGSVLSD